MQYDYDTDVAEKVCDTLLRADHLSCRIKRRLTGGDPQGEQSAGQMGAGNDSGKCRNGGKKTSALSVMIRASRTS